MRYMASVGRPRKKGKILTIKMEENILKGLDKASNELNITRTALIERAVTDYIERMNGVIEQNGRIHPIVSLDEYIQQGTTARSE